MHLYVDRGECLTSWTTSGFERVSEHIAPNRDSLAIALVNNMPDGAIEDTESQFLQLLKNATFRFQVHVRLYSLPGVSRSDWALRYLSENYAAFQDLFGRQFDGVIVTGTEPKQPDLKREPYWRNMVDLLDWAEENTGSAILSCLAVHASVLHSDGIIRTPLPEKQFGVFEYHKCCGHPLIAGRTNPVRLPHSRWNGIERDSLESTGHTILTNSPEFGVDTFIKEKKQSLFLHFQGHPEYATETLLKEYRRDVRRYLKKEREIYPSLPRGYFDQATTVLLGDFRLKALAERQDGTMEFFPHATTFDTIHNNWHETAQEIYSNWLEYLFSRKANRFPKAISVRAGL
jgi:homoserine O-succinyltransferase/O-acetyltransferase